MPHEHAAQGRRFCYVVMEHVQPERVLRLAKAIRMTSPNALVVTLYNGHLAGVDEDELRRAGVLRVGSGRAAQWGAWSVTERVLEGLADALRLEWDWLVLISGQDYPIADLTRWEEATRAREVEGLVRAQPVRTTDRELVERYSYRWRRLWGLGPATSVRNRAAVSVLWRACRHTTLIAMRHDGASVWLGVRPKSVDVRGLWKGDLWMALSRRAVGVLLERHLTGEGRRFHDSLLADEAYAPTLLYRSGIPLLSEPVSLTRWQDDDPAHPRPLTPDDFESLVSSGAPFARKIAGEPGDRLIELLDAAVRAARPEG